jgi:hypothetical protein
MPGIKMFEEALTNGWAGVAREQQGSLTQRDDLRGRHVLSATRKKDLSDDKRAERAQGRI